MKKKMLTVFAVVCLLCASLVTFTACGNTTKKLSLTDYALSLTQAQEEGLITDRKAVAKLTYVGTTMPYADGTNTTVVTIDGKKGLYNYKTDTFIANAQYDDVQQLSGVAMCRDDGGTVIYSTDGTALLPYSSYYEARVQSPSGSTLYYGDERITYTIDYRKNASDETEHIYLYLDKDGHAVAATASQVKDYRLTTANDAVTARTEYPLEKFDGFARSYAENDSFLSSYRLSEEETQEGKTIYFNSGSKITSLSVPENTEGLMYASGKVLYCVREKVAHDAKKGYNFVNASGSKFNTDEKFNDTYYIFDIAKGKTKKLKLDYSVYDIRPMYNRNKSCYDAFMIKAIPCEKKVATYNNANDIHVYITDFEGKIGYDLTDCNYNGGTLIALKDGRLLIRSTQGSYIVDGSGKKLAYLGGNCTVNPSAELITVYNGNRYGAVDFDGNVLLGYDYSALVFYGKTALATVYSPDGNKEKLVSSDARDGKDIKDVIPSMSEEDVVIYQSNGIIVIQDADETERNGKDVYVAYNYDGTKLMALEADSLDVYTSSSLPGGAFVRFEKRSGYDYETEYYSVK